MIKIAIKIAIIIFLAETLIMLGLSFVEPAPSGISATIIDAIFLTIISTPLICFWVTNPFVEAHDRIDQELAKARDGLEIKVKERTKELSESEERFRSVTQSATDAIIAIDANSTVISWNQGAVNIFGYKENEILGEPLFCLIPERFREGHENALEHIQSGGEPHLVGKTVELFGLRKNGDEFPIELSLGIWTEKDKTFFSGIIRDITERIKARSLLYTVLESSPVPLAITRISDGQFIFANPAAETMIGMTVDELDGYQAKGLYVNPDDRLPMVAALKKDGEINDYEVLMKRKDGTQYWMSFNARAAEIENEKVLIAGMIDITERKETEVQLRQAQKVTALGNLAGGITHELNNLLLPIATLTRMALKKLPDNHTEREKLEKVVEASDRAKDVVEQVLAFSRMEELKQENLEIAKIINDSTKLIETTSPSTVKIRKQVDDNAGVIFADAGQIKTILINLASNSLDAMEGKIGEMIISLSRVDVNEKLASLINDLNVGAYAKLSVSDTGHGMNVEALERLFDPFFTTKNVGEGTGLGLSIVHGIMANHEGAINVSSEVGVGTTIEVYLPLAELEE